MDTTQFTSHVKRIAVSSIEVNPDNPRGQFDTATDPSFERLASSVKKMGVLVPIVVRRLSGSDGHAKYQLVDGERRYWAARKVGRTEIAAHVLETGVSSAELRKVMFHLHMTREQWGPWAQCRALEEIYPELESGVSVSKKDYWIHKVHDETNTSAQTARDRIRVLSWSRELKKRVQEFVDKNPKADIYSYVLAIEASVIEPSLEAFPEFYGSPRTPKVNAVRRTLLEKTINGIETGLISNRETIRSVDCLFVRSLTDGEKKIARSIFRTLATKSDYSYDDARSDCAAQLPGIFAENPPKPRRLLALIESLTRALEKCDKSYLERSLMQPTKRREAEKAISDALKKLQRAATNLLNQL